MTRLVAVFLVGAFAASAAWAQSLSDPTRPPEAPTPDAKAGQEVVIPSRLQSVLVSSGRKVAVIDGRAYRLGEKVGDAQVVRITETEVVLKNGAQSETLRMLPAVEKKPVSRSTAADESKGRRR